MVPLLSNQYETHGSPDAPPLLLVHGSTVMRAMWWAQIEALAADFYVIAPDLPGHGASAHLPFSLDGAVTLLDQVVAQVAYRPVVVVGISLGGYVALEFAAAHHKRVTGLVLASTTVNFTGALGVYIKLVGWLLGRALDEGWQRKQLIQSMRRKNPAEIAEPLIRAGLYPRATGEAFLALAGRDFRRALVKIDCPVLFLNGANDTASRRGEHTFLAATRHGHVEHIASAGHLCNLQQPAAFNAVVRHFAVDVIGAHSATVAVSRHN